MAKSKKAKKITNKDVEGEFSKYSSDRERIIKTSNDYESMSISDAFASYYGVKKSEIDKNSSPNVVTVINLGDVYLGHVKELEKGNITFEIPGVNEELICMENLNMHLDALRNYCLTHDNTMYFEVREKKGDKYMVSIINAYYRLWEAQIKQCIENEEAITVHIDNLTKGGYNCHIPISTINELLSLDTYTLAVFIPGSQIVLNIEKEFERWLDMDVQVIPQKLTDYYVHYREKMTEKSLICSRKRFLEMVGDHNMHNLFKKWELSKKSNAKVSFEALNGRVTGVINSAKKTGVFVEIDDKYITGMLPVENASELANYHPGDSILVKIREFEIQEGKSPFVFHRNGNIKKRNCRPVFDLA